MTKGGGKIRERRRRSGVGKSKLRIKKENIYYYNMR